MSFVCQDSVICIEEDQTATPQQRAPGKGNTQKPLRSLNDVLGKATQAAKETKTLPGNLSYSAINSFFGHVM